VWLWSFRGLLDARCQMSARRRRRSATGKRQRTKSDRDPISPPALSLRFARFRGEGPHVSARALGFVAGEVSQTRNRVFESSEPITDLRTGRIRVGENAFGFDSQRERQPWQHSHGSRRHLVVAVEYV
jgi:hypothetical protein